MKILHTADWHLNARLGHQDLSNDICASLTQIAHYLEIHDVDVMIVAGDVFEHGRTEQMRIAVSTIREIFRPFLAKGGTMIAISGNHDNEAFFETLRLALDLVVPGKSEPPNNSRPTGRLYIAPDPGILRLADRNGQVVQFVLMPYPTPRCYLREQNLRYQSIEEKHRAIHQNFVKTLRTLQQKFDDTEPNVLVSHVHVRGTTGHNLYRLSEIDDVIFDSNTIPSTWTYVAYGHIHKPQEAVKGAPHIRYSGSIQALDAGEANDEKSVVLFEIADNILVSEPELLPLETTPIYQVEIKDPDTQLSQLQSQYPEAKNALVQYTLHCDPDRPDLSILYQKINEIFPRWYDRKIQRIGSAISDETNYSPHNIQDVINTTRDYLQEVLSSDPEKDELLGLIETLLAEGG